MKDYFQAQNKFGLIRFDVIIYIGAARIIINHIGLLKSALLEVFTRNFRLDF